MTAVFKEGDLQLTVNNVQNARRFDDYFHGVSQMKAVDFIIELPDRYLYIEFKDPQHPDSRDENRREFIQDFHSGRLDEDLKYKYRDSFLYEWACGRADKPIYYLVLVALDTLTVANLLTRTEALKYKLPVDGPNSWCRLIVSGCTVLNLSRWNQTFPESPVDRIAGQS